ncbi:SDR family NAD(P)-dependent oxidoreductase [Inquilinus sp. CAU 1745]|uniref:SDR family NAD(P)-dependent oxidoreductase n=1 Tax=Inquilinus sp. CAU 1745 TaxID=3140369 RepID=UPI00325B4FC4
MYEMLDPSRLVVFVTGATSGIGRAAVRRFAGAGAKVIAAGRRGDRLAELQAEVGAERCLAVELDVRDRAATERAIDAIPAPFAGINTVVANAGLALGLEPAQKVDLADWETMVDTNVKGLLYTVRTLLPRLESGGGHVVTVGSVAGDYPYPGGSVYAASKAFVRHFALGLRADLLGTQVRVTNIEPGMTETEFSTVRFKGDEARARSKYEGVVSLSAEDIAESIFWATTLPRHVNINRIQMMPVSQAFSPLSIHKEEP